MRKLVAFLGMMVVIGACEPGNGCRIDQTSGAIICPAESPTPTFEAETATAEPAERPIIINVNPPTLRSVDEGIVSYCVTVRDPDSLGELRWSHSISPNVGHLSGTRESEEWGEDGVVTCWLAAIDLDGSPPAQTNLKITVSDNQGLSDTRSVYWSITE